MHFVTIIAIGWIYVTLLMSLTQDTVLAGIFTFLFYGLLPVSIVVYIFTTPVRKRRRLAQEQAEEARLKAAKAAEPKADGPKVDDANPPV